MSTPDHDPPLRVWRVGEMIALEGDLDLDTRSLLESVVAVTTDDEPVVLDLSRVWFVDSQGLRSLLAIQDRHQLTLARPSQAVRRLLEIAGVEAMFHILADDATSSDGNASTAAG